MKNPATKIINDIHFQHIQDHIIQKGCPRCEGDKHENTSDSNGRGSK